MLDPKLNLSRHSSIFATPTNIHCRGLGKLFDSSSSDNNVSAGSQFEAPLWLGLALSQRNIVELRFYQSKGDSLTFIVVPNISSKIPQHILLCAAVLIYGCFL